MPELVRGVQFRFLAANLVEQRLRLVEDAGHLQESVNHAFV